MTRARKLTLTMKEFSHLVSESLDLANAVPPTQSLVDSSAVFSESPRKTHHHRPSSFQRIFSRSATTPGQREDFPQSGPPEDPPESPRKMIAWPFSRSPRKNRPIKEDNTIEVNEPGTYRTDRDGASPYSVSSPAAASTSSLGSLLPAHERLFQVADEQSCHVFRVSCSSPVTIIPPLTSESSGYYAPLDTIFGNGSATSVLTNSTIEPISGIRISCQATKIRPTFESAASLSATNTDRESSDDDPTPRASTFGSRATLPSAASQDNWRGCLSLTVPLHNAEVLALRPAVGVAPQAPSDTESSISVCSTSSPPSPVASSSSPTFPTMKLSGSGTFLPHVPLTPPNTRVSALSPGIASPSNLESAPPLGYSPRQRKRAMSRSLTPPPLSRPPPTGPLPAVPSSVPPVPPLPPLLSRISMSPNTAVSLPPRSTISGAPTNPITALPPSPPGGLRLPSRLSWVNSVRAVLPSPPASPTKSLKCLAGKTPLPISPSKAGIKRPNELKRPTSIGVIEATDNVQVRRTKSILLLGSRSKSNVSLGTKRVQIRADVNLDPGPNLNPKPRRKSSAATVGHPTFSSHSGPGVVSRMQSSELLVLRERRHSAPVLSSVDSNSSGASADWTLSLPLCTDVPGHQILMSPLHTPQLKPEQNVEDVQGEDWTLCMPLKARVGTPTVESVEGPDTECTLADTAETRPSMQLPTPSPSPTSSTPVSVVCPLEPEEGEPLPDERPASPASLGPHVGGLDLAGGRGKRASGWHVYGWFDEVKLPEEDEQEVVPLTPTTPASSSECKFVKSHVAAFRKMHDASGRHPSQDSMSTSSTSGTTFYSARSSLLVN